MAKALPYVGMVVGAIIGTIIAPGVGTAIGASLGGSLGSLAAAILVNPKTIQQQVEFRGGERDPHPVRRFFCGRARSGLAEVFRHVDGEMLRRSFLIASEPIEDFEELWLYGDTHVTPLTNTAERNAYDLTSAGARVDGIHDLPVGNYDRGQVEIWIGRGDQTQFPSEWVTALSGTVPAISTASWKGRSVLHMNAEFGDPHDASRRWRGRMPTVELVVKGGKRYDPTKDSTLSALGGSGTHRRDDPTTWEYTRNAAANALHILRARDGVGRSNRQILIDDWMEAINDCGRAVSTSVTLDPVANAETTSAAAFAKGITLTGFDPRQEVRFLVTDGGWDQSVDDNIYRNGFYVAADSDHANPFISSDYATGYVSQAAAVDAAETLSATGGSSYTLYIVDDPFNDNEHDLTISVEADPLFAADGLVIVDSREADLVGGVVEAMGGFLSPSAGKMGVRAGVWKAPTETLSKALVRGFKWTSRSEPAVDCVIATYLDEAQGWQKTETRKVLCECSGRRTVDASSYNLVLADAGLHVRMTTASASVTLPAQATVAWSDFDRIVVEFVEGGTLAGVAGVTITAPDGLTAVAGEFIRLVRTASDAWRAEITTMDRVHPLDLPMVSNRRQATHLAKIKARRFWYNRTIEGFWGGVEYKHRVGDTVTFNRADLPIVNGDYMVEAESLEPAEAPGGGLMLLKRMTLREDAEAIYAFDPATEYDALPVFVSNANYTDLNALLTLDCYQEDYLDTSGNPQARLVGVATIASGSGLSTVDVEFGWQVTDEGAGDTWTDLVTETVDLETASTATARLEPVQPGVSYKLRARIANFEIGLADWVECGPTVIVAPVADPLEFEDGTGNLLMETGFVLLLD